MADKSSAAMHSQNPPDGKHTHDALVVSASPEPWYLRGWRAVKNPKVAPYLGVGLFLIIGIVFTIATLNPFQVTTRATTHLATVSVLPAKLSLPPNGTLQVWATTDSPLAFVNVELIFNPVVVKLTAEATLTTSAWGRVIKQTAMADANTTGRLDLVVGLDPSHIQTPPNGTFQIATLQFGANTTIPNSITTVMPYTTSQLVAIDTTVFTLTAVGSTITVNPLPTPTPTSTPTPTPTPTPTSTPIPTPTPTQSPTPTPTRPPTPTPTRTPTPTPYPTTIPTPTPTPTPIPVTDVVTIQSAYMSKLFKLIPRLTVVATSNMAPNAQLTVTGFGSLRYSKTKYSYSANFWVIGTWPTYVTVTSSQGGSATLVVGRQ